MFGRKPNHMNSRLDATMDSILDEMGDYGPVSPEYPQLLEHLEKVCAIRKSDDKRRPTPDGMILVLGNLLGILIIVAYEQKHVMTSKGLGFVMKPKN